MNGSRAWLEKDFYAILGVSENATPEEIKRTYRKLARELHPDRNPGNKPAEERMKDASEAYDVLSDPKKRTEYDEIRRLSRSGFRGFGPGAGGGFSAEDLGGFDIGDLFGDLFGGRRGARRRRRGPDLETTISLSFEQAVRGATVPVALPRDASCSQCNGSGDRSGRATTCARCGGTGSISENQGPFSFMRTCPACGGVGRTVADPCPRCGGSGVERRREEVRVRIPAGVQHGARILVRGRGAAAPGGEPGDLFVVVSVEPHPIFGRRGDDLTVTVPIAFTDAALGAEIAVPTLDGPPVTVKVPAGTQPGTTMRVRGKGVPRARGNGDLLVTLQVEVPRKLSREEKELLEQLAALNGTAKARSRKK